MTERQSDSRRSVISLSCWESGGPGTVGVWCGEGGAPLLEDEDGPR